MVCPGGGWSPACEVASQVTSHAGESAFGGFADGVAESVVSIAAWTATWWLEPSSYTSDTSLHVQGWVAPIAAAVAVGGVLWQALLMIVSRRPEPVFQIVRVLWSTALWGAIGVAGTHLVLRAGDEFSLWVVDEGIGTVTKDGLTRQLLALLLPVVALPPGLTVLIGVVVVLGGFVQALLMFFREISVVILAGLLQLAAAGVGTQATAQWRPKVVAWCAALATYKPVAALVYTVGLVLAGDPDNAGPRSTLAGITVMVLSLLALPLLMRLFTWTTGSLQSGSGLGLLAAAGAGGLHATASLRGAGGRDTNDYIRYLETSLTAPTKAATPTGGSSAPPSFQGSAGSRGASAASSPAAGASPSSSSAAGATGAGGAAAGGVGAAAAVAQAGASAARRGADRAGRTMTDPPEGA